MNQDLKDNFMGSLKVTIQKSYQKADKYEYMDPT